MVFLGTGSFGFTPFGAEPAAFFGFGPFGLTPKFLSFGFGFGVNGSLGSVPGGYEFLGSGPGGNESSLGSSSTSPG